MTRNSPLLSLRAYTNRSLERTVRSPASYVRVLVGVALSFAFSGGTRAQELVPPAVTLVPATALSLTGGVDSNSPAVWDLVDGVETLQVLTSIAGQPSLASGRRLTRMGPAEPVSFISHPGDGVWMESVVVDDGGTWYGYYHNEVPAAQCGRLDRTLPRIGAARSRDHGETWEDLGIILEAPPGWYDCETSNQFFVGGVGDLSVVLDRESKDLYLYFSQYSKYAGAQGVALARLVWADRDAPAGKVTVYNDGVWLPASRVVSDDGEGSARAEWAYPYGTPLVAPKAPWHDADPTNDAFWGASVHWNVSLQLYVMLLNRARDEQFTQEGVYVSFAKRIDDPSAWTTPIKIVEGGSWYPQVMGLETGAGSDKQASGRARFFMGGRSNAFIEFSARP
jgi:hypothetical protein